MADNYADKVCRSAVAHVCYRVGASRSYPSVLNTLADVTKEYIKTIGRQSSGVAVNGGRADVSAVDIMSGLKQMGYGQATWMELKKFAFNESGGPSWHFPCPVEVPMLPVRKRKREHFAVVGSQNTEARPAHIPSWLPPLPPKHTYKKTRSKAVKTTMNSSTLRKDRTARKQDIAVGLVAQKKLEDGQQQAPVGSTGESHRNRKRARE